MSKKLLSVLLAILMVVSSVSCLFTMSTITASAEEENLMANISASDWTSGWTGNPGTTVELDGIAVKGAYRSVYTKVTLNPEAKHTFSFSFGQVRVGDVRVYPASEITDPATQLMSVGSSPAVGGTTNLATGTFETELAKGAPADGAFYKASETFKTTTDTEYYIILDCYDFVTTSVVLRNLSLVEHPYDPNVLADTTNSDWYSNMSTSGANYNATEGAIFVRGAGASVYTKVTLEPYTKYTFSFSSSRVEPKDVVVYAADDNVTNLSGAAWAAYVSGGTNLAAGALNTNLPEYNFATTDDEEYVIKYYDSSETFTTNAATEYYISINCGNFGDALPDGVAARNTGLHLKNLSLVPHEPEANVLNDDTMKSLAWTALWGSATRNPKTADLDASASYSGESYAMTWDRNSRYRDNYTTVILEANTTYNFSFRYKSSSNGQGEYVDLIGFVDASKVDFSAFDGDYIKNHLTDSSTPILGKDNAIIGEATDGTWNLVSTTFTTGDAREYILYINPTTKTDDAGYQTLTLSDFVLEVNTDPNVLADTTNSDWYSNMSTSGASYNATEGAIFVRGAGASVYTKVTLEPYTKYTFSFSSSRVEPKDVVVYAADDNVTNLSDAAWAAYVSGGTNLAAGALTTNLPEYNFATTTDEEYVITYYDSSETFTTSAATEYYIAINCGNFGAALPDGVDARHTGLHLRNLSLVPHEPEANVLNDDAMASLTWNAIWNTGLRNPKEATLDKSQSYSENAYAMTWNRNSRYRDNYTTVILEANTTYNFSFRYKSSSDGQGEFINDIGFVDASKVDFTTYKGDKVSAHITDSTTTILGKDNATIGKETDGTWNLVTTTFTTGDAREYVMYLNPETKNGDTGFQIFTLSDFVLEAQAADSGNSGTAVGENILANITKDDWTSAWDSSKGYTLTTMAIQAAWHTAYTKVTLAPNTNYDFSFGASNVKVSGVKVFSASEIGDITALHNSDGNMVCDATDLVNAFSAPAPAEDYSKSTEDIISQVYTVSASFTTNTTDTDYYILIDGGSYLPNGRPNASSVFVKNFSLISKGEVVIDPNVLNDTAMKKLTWNALWGTVTRNPKSAELDKSESYSGEAYAMSWGSNSRFRDNYTTVTLKPNTTYNFSFYYLSGIYQERVGDIGFVDASKVDFTTYNGDTVEAHLTDSSTTILGKDNAIFDNNNDGVNWSKVSTTFTTTEATEYVMYLHILFWDDYDAEAQKANNTFSGITLSDFDLREYVDPNKLANATVANGDVRFSVGADSDDYYITGAEGKEDELVTYTNGEGESVTINRVYYYDSKNPSYNYNGGYAWRIIISSTTAMNVYNPAVYGYISAKGLEANTKYTFSYIYTDTYHIKLGDIYNASGSVGNIDVTTKMLPTKSGSNSHAYMVTANFTTGDAGDYTIKLQTGRSDKYYIYDGSSWAMTLSDLSLLPYEEPETVVIPDDANLLENPDELDWKATWSTITHSTNGYNGTKAISLGGIQYHALYTRLDTLAPNTEYALTFKYKSHAAIDVVGVTDAANVNLENVNEKFNSAVVKGGNITYYQNVEKVIDNATWNNATVKFVTGDSTTYYLYFEGNSAANSAVTGGFVISDMSLTKVLDNSNAIVVDYDFENGTIGAVSTTSGADAPSIAEENGNKYLKFTRTNDGVTVPFYYRANQKYVVSFDMKVLSYPTEQLQFRFRTSEGDNNPITYEGNVFAYNNNAYSLVTKDLNGNLLSGPDGLNNSDDYQFKGYKQDIENHTDWVHYEITIDPDYTYYTGLANLGFDADEAGWSIALDNIKVAALNDEFEADAEAKFEPTKYAAIRAKAANAYQGIRVKSSIDTSLLAGDIKVVEYGTLAINNSKLGGKELVYDMVNSTAYGAKIGVAYSVDDDTNVIFEQNGNIVTFTGTLIGLKDYTTDYAVRGYMIAESKDGARFVIYEEDTTTVSVYDVVYAILNDGVENDDDAVANAIVSRNEAEYNSFVEENYTEEELTASETVSLNVYNSTAPVIENYRGFSGTVYHAFGFMEDDATGRVYDEAMINTELDRLEDAGVHYLRTRYQSQWIFDDATGYDWNSDRFNYFLNYAKALQERDMEVILQVGWHFDFISREENATYSIHENEYFNGEGADLYGESAGVDFTGKSADDTRIIKAAYRYAYMMANTVKLAKAKGINNIKYFSYFVEPSNSYSVSEDGSILDTINLKAGHDKEQYVLFCRTMRDALEDIHDITGIKHVGPNEAGYSKLIEYVLEKDPTLFDILTAHNYPEEGDVQTNYDKYYETMTENSNSNILSGDMTDFSAYAEFLETAKSKTGNSDIEFWSDEFNIKDFDAYQGRGTSSFYRGLATAMGGIVAQQKGIQNIVLWMSFDQLWTDRTGGTEESKSEFMNGIHQCGNAPSLFLSDQPYAQYYPTTLFSKYNGYQNGKVYKTTLANNGVYIGAVQLENGEWTVSVLNMNSTAVEISVDFDAAINQTLYRHIVSADKADTYADAKIPDADKSFDVAASFNDVLPAGSFAVYTGVK